jgi:hypothetical protein
VAAAVVVVVLFVVVEAAACAVVAAAVVVVAAVETAARAVSPLLPLLASGCIRLSRGRKPRKLAETIAERK